MPVSDVAKMAADHIQFPVGSTEAGAALFLVAPLFMTPTDFNLAAYTGIGLETVRCYWSRMEKSGLWTAQGPVDRARYLGESEEDYLTLILDVLLCLGQVRRKAGPDGEGLWYRA